MLVVEDEGPGVPAELREAVFEPFRQAPGRVASTPPGSAWSVPRPPLLRAARGPGLARGAAGGGASFHVFLPGG